ncbi:DUF1573 domain-containing protein [Aquimarina sp. W85]|uniref:Ig-like domain-containing protein n=1 Tax=Aquimarina rhodophyticola TaxID=3342246 RepID=UPI00366A55ED
MKSLLKNYSFLLLFYTLLLCSCSSSDSDDGIVSTPKEEEEEKPVENASLVLTVRDDTSLDFGEVVQNFVFTKKIKITNSGNIPLEISSISVPNGFSLDWSSGTIPVEGSKDITVEFTPDKIDDFGGVISVNSNAGTVNNTLTCAGKGVSDIFEEDLILSDQQEIEDFIKRGFKEIKGTLYIAYTGKTSYDRNISITSLESLSQLRSINAIRINSTVNLSNLNGLENLDIKGSIALVDNIGLENIDGLKNIVNINGFLQIAGCSSLRNLDSLGNLTTVRFIVTITSNDLLENLNGLNKLKSIGGNLQISFNPFINNLDGLSNLETIEEGLSIEGNARLNNFCSLRTMLNSGGLKGYFRETSFNRYNPSKSDVMSGDCTKDFPQGVYGGNLNIRSKNEYNTFISQNFEGIDGNLTINNRDSDILTLEELSGLKSVSGTLYINQMVIEDLKGLQNLENVQGNVQISQNANLSDFCDILPLINGNGLSGTFTASGNPYNPTRQDLEAGTCTQ